MIMNTQTPSSSKAVASLDSALAAALERIDAPLAFAESLRTLDSGIHNMDGRLEPLAASPDHQVQALAARASLHGINVPLHDAMIAAAALAANVGPTRDALVQMRVWIESANREHGCLASALADLTEAVTAMNEDLASLTEVDAAVSSACNCIESAQTAAAPLLKGPQGAPKAVDFFWSFAAEGEAPVARIRHGVSDIVHSYDAAAASDPTPAPPQPQPLEAEPPVNLDLKLPDIPRLYELPQELQRLVARFGDLRQAMGCVIGMIRALESV
jgi:hypothetical protein